MKVDISKDAVKHLLLIADDFWNLEREAPTWNYIAIMKNLLLANKYRKENEGLELASETIEWMFSLLDMLVATQTGNKTKVSAEARKALTAEMKKQRW